MTDKDILNSEINLIQDEEKRKIVKDLIGKLPDYFLKYQPAARANITLNMHKVKVDL